MKESKQIPKQNNKPAVPKQKIRPDRQDRIGHIIERDILFVIISMLVFSLVEGKPNIAFIIPSVIVTLCGELLAAMKARASEPDSVRNSKKFVSSDRLFMRPSELFPVSEVSEQDASDIQSARVQPAGDISLDDFSKAASRFKQRASAQRNSSTVSDTRNRKARPGVFVLITVIFVISIIISIGLPLLINFIGDTDVTVNDEDHGSYSTMDFYSEEFLSKQSDEVFSRLSAGDLEWLKEFGEGDPQGLLDVMDWGNIDIKEDTRSYNDQECFIRYNVTSKGSEYKVAIKYSGPNISEDDSDVTVEGIAVCPRKVWDDFSDAYYKEDSELTYDDLFKSIAEATVSVGDNTYYDDYTTLTW